MTLHQNVQEFSLLTEPKKIGILRRMLGFLAKLLSGAKGDQGGWEGGARGL
jgi:hypothetical protein